MKRASIMSYRLQLLANRLCEQHDLEPVTIVVRGNMGKTLGRAIYNSRTLEISAHLCNNDPDKIDDILRHEIAHFIAYDLFGHMGHGQEWIHACSMVGAAPNELLDHTTTNPQALGIRYLYACTASRTYACTQYAYRRLSRLENPQTRCKKHGLRFTKEVLKPLDAQ